MLRSWDIHGSIYTMVAEGVEPMGLFSPLPMEE
jgi:hypothetical protein